MFLKELSSMYRIFIDFSFCRVLFDMYVGYGYKNCLLNMRINVRRNEDFLNKM